MDSQTGKTELTFRGKPVREMSQEELIAALEFAARSLEQKDERIAALEGYERRVKRWRG